MAERLLATPVGELRVVTVAAGVRAVLWPGDDHHRVHLGDPDNSVEAERIADSAVLQLNEYFAGTRTSFDLPLDPIGTVFQRSAWNVLRTIPYGRTMSYAEQARSMGDAKKARAVGAANGRNPISIIVPCHRVVGSTGALTGFAGGLDTKSWLLRHEQGVTALPV